MINAIKKPLALILIMMLLPVYAQDTPADNMDIFMDKIIADRRAIIAANMDFTQSEADAFWPVYDEHQKEFEAIDHRLAELMVSYADAHNAMTLDDDSAIYLIKEMLKIERDEIDLKKSLLSDLNVALPGMKVARYLQIENRIRAVDRYELAALIPLNE